MPKIYCVHAAAVTRGARTCCKVCKVCWPSHARRPPKVTIGYLSGLTPAQIRAAQRLINADGSIKRDALATHQGSKPTKVF